MRSRTVKRPQLVPGPLTVRVEAVEICRNHHVARTCTVLVAASGNQAQITHVYAVVALDVVSLALEDGGVGTVEAHAVVCVPSTAAIVVKVTPSAFRLGGRKQEYRREGGESIRKLHGR